MRDLVASDAAAVQEALREGAPLRPVAGGTHTAMLPTDDDPVLALDVSGLAGVVDYDPAELTFTARPGTTLAEIDAMLASHGQHLPFDPPRLGVGATLGGAVAAGVTGPGGFAAGVRDFVIGVRFVDGTGRLAAGGGRVVKNAAGFDLPKLMVGSLGRLGVIVELSLKVFPRPEATATVRADKEREAGDGFDGTWVAHPDVVGVATAAFDAVLGGRPNQIERRRDDVTADAAALVDLRSTPGQVTEAGMRSNVSIGFQYISFWLGGRGAVGLNNLMEDAATAEISRSQIWQLIHKRDEAARRDDDRPRAREPDPRRGDGPDPRRGR